MALIPFDTPREEGRTEKRFENFWAQEFFGRNVGWFEVASQSLLSGNWIFHICQRKFFFQRSGFSRLTIVLNYKNVPEIKNEQVSLTPNTQSSPKGKGYNERIRAAIIMFLNSI